MTSQMSKLSGDLLTFVSAHPTPVFAGSALLLIALPLSRWMFSSKKNHGEKNPFKDNHVRKREQLIIDQKQRDAVLKQGFLPKKVPENLDAIVIGSGIGGLTTATLLARTGKRVLVLEQHDRAGGCCHTFIEKGYEFDVGIHYIGNVSHNSVFQVLIEQLTSGQVAWESLDQDYDVVCLDIHKKPKFFEHRLGRENWKNHLVEMFPSEKAGIEKYMKFLEEASRASKGQVMLKTLPQWLTSLLVTTGLSSDINTFLKLSKKTTLQVLEECTSNRDLQAVLCSNLGDYGVTPKKSSFLMQAALNNHYMWSASYPIGGASELIIHMIPAIEATGGRVLVRAPVSQILTDSSGKATGVRVARSSGDVDIHAPLVISNAGLINTLSLLPKTITTKSSLTSLVTKRKVQSSIACLQVFVGLKGTPEELGLKAQNIWAYSGNNYDEIFDEYLSLSSDEVLEADPPLAFISMMSAKDPSFQDRFPGKSTITVVGLCRWEWFMEWKKARVNKRGDEYEQYKSALGHKLWDMALKLYPHLEDKVEYFDIGSPLTNDYYLGTKQGELYGLDHNLTRFSDPEVVSNLRAGTDVPNLYMTGQDILSCGYAGGMYSGLLTASAVLNRNLFSDLLQLRATIINQQKNKDD